MENEDVKSLRKQATQYRAIKLKERLERMSEDELKEYRKKRAKYQRNYINRKKKKSQNQEVK